MATYGYTFTSGDTVTPTKLNNARTVTDIVNADIKSDAAIAGTKISPDFGSQNAVTTGTVTGAKLVPTGTSATGNGMYLPATNAVAISTDGTERMRIDSGGRVLIGSTTNVGFQTLQAHSTSPADVAGIYRWAADSSGPRINLVKSRGASVGTNTIVQSGDTFGIISFRGADGDDTATVGASIEAYVDGTPGADDMPGRLVFATTADGGSSPTERMRITSSGNVGIGTSSPLSTNGGLDIASGGLGLVLGAESGSIQRSNNTAKLGRIVCPHYTNAEEPVCGIIVSSDSGANVVNIGGGSVLTNAATEINFRTASTGTTTVGTIRLLIDSSGNVGVGTATPNAAALLDVSSTTKGFLPPRMTTAQRDAITTPPAGLLIYNTSTNKLNVRTASSWEAVTSS